MPTVILLDELDHATDGCWCPSCRAEASFADCNGDTDRDSRRRVRPSMAEQRKSTLRADIIDGFGQTYGAMRQPIMLFRNTRGALADSSTMKILHDAWVG